MTIPSPARVLRDVDLRPFNTFGIPARAEWLVEVDDASQLPGALTHAPLAGTRPLVLGGGSNMLFVGAIEAPVLRLTGTALEILDDGADGTVVYADAGLQWHDLVMRTVAMGLAGLENLALIPGTVGASPIQNIGAYGVEVRERIEAVHAFEPITGQPVRMPAADCAFAYRDSIFKQQPDRWIVTGVEFRLHRAMPPTLAYAGLADELAAMDVQAPTARDIATAVSAIRRRKLPDPAVIGNAGSFFKNPIVPEAIANALREAHPALPVFPAGEGLRKLSAAWLIDSLGFKGCREGDAGIAASHALVLVNHGNATGAQLLALARRVADTVEQGYGVALEPEPRVVGASWR